MIAHYFVEFLTPKYQQFDNKFQPDLTIFDMLFFCGKKQTISFVKDINNLKLSNNWKI